MGRTVRGWWWMAVGTACLAGCNQAPVPSVPPKPAAATTAPATPSSAPSAQPSRPEAAAPTGDSQAALPAGDLAELRRTLAATTDGRTRVLTIDAIAELGQRGRDALPELLAATTDDDPRPRWHAARAVGLIGEDAVSAVPTLVKLLADPDPIVVTQAAAAIGMVRKDDGDVTPAEAAIYESTVDPLVKTTVHADPRARRAALRALRTVHSEPAKLAALIGRSLQDSDPSVVMPALQTLADIEDHAVPVLVEALKDPKSRFWAEVAVAEIGPEAAAAVPQLAAIVQQAASAPDAAPEEGLQALLALAAIGPAAAKAAPQFIAALDSPHAFLRAAAAFAAGSSGAADADGALAKAEADEDAFLAATASWARAKIRPDDAAARARAVERLQKAVRSPDPRMRKAAVSGLSDLADRLAAADQEALAVEFAELLDDPDEAVGLAAGGGLVRLGRLAVDHLRTRVKEPPHRLQALGVLAAIGPAAAAALPDVQAALADPDEAIATEAGMALAAIGGEAAPAVPELAKLLADGVPAGLRYTAAYALGRIGPTAKAALPRLLELAKSDDEIMATCTAWAALKIDPADAKLVESAIPLLRKALRGDRDMVRLEAAVSLGDIGKAAGSAIPLLELVSEEDAVPAVRAAAAEALAKIRVP